MKSFLICHRGALGDFVLTWPALHSLRNVLPDHRFLGLGRLEYMRLAVKLGLLDHCLNAESARMLSFFSGQAIPPEIGSPEGAVLWLAKGRDMARLLRKSSSQPVLIIDPFPRERIHVATYYCQAIQSQFAVTIHEHLFPCFSIDVRRGDYVLIHPGSGSIKKNYSPGLYLDLAEELRSRGCQEIRFVLGPAEERFETAGYFSKGSEERPESIIALAELLAGAALFIGNDSGVSHLSGVLGTPTIALYKNTDPAVWGVTGRNVVNICAADENSAFNKVRGVLPAAY